jgi:hypothetical protein
MRGEPIDAHTAPLHLLFEGAKGQSDKVAKGMAAATAPDFSHSSHFSHFSHSVSTIGIGDGGNEIGMGLFPWPALHPLIAGQHGRRIACRIATDWTIIAGTSNCAFARRGPRVPSRPSRPT